MDRLDLKIKDGEIQVLSTVSLIQKLKNMKS